MLEEISENVFVYGEFAIVVAEFENGTEWVVINKQGNVLLRSTFSKCIWFVKRDVLKSNINRFKEILSHIRGN